MLENVQFFISEKIFSRLDNKSFIDEIYKIYSKYFLEPINSNMLKCIYLDIVNYLYSTGVYNDDTNDFRPIIPNVNVSITYDFVKQQFINELL